MYFYNDDCAMIRSRIGGHRCMNVYFNDGEDCVLFSSLIGSHR